MIVSVASTFSSPQAGRYILFTPLLVNAESLVSCSLWSRSDPCYKRCDWGSAKVARFHLVSVSLSCARVVGGAVA